MDVSAGPGGENCGTRQVKFIGNSAQEERSSLLFDLLHALTGLKRIEI